MNEYFYAAFVCCFILGYFIGNDRGKKQVMQEIAEREANIQIQEAYRRNMEQYMRMNQEDDDEE